MDQLYARFTEIGKVANPFWIPLPHDDYEGGFVDEAAARKRMPVAGGETAALQPLRITFDRKYCHLGRRALQNLIGDCFRSRERRLKPHLLAMKLLPPRRETGKDRLLERLFHDREAVKRDRDVAAFGGWFGQATRRHKRYTQTSCSNRRHVLGSSLPHEDTREPPHSYDSPNPLPR